MKNLLPILMFSMFISMMMMFYIVIIPMYFFCLMMIIMAKVIERFLAQFRRNKIFVS